MSQQITRESSIAMLSNCIRAGQKMGAFLLREAYVLKKALDYLDPKVPQDQKPTYENAENPETTAVNLLLQGVQKAQAHGGDHAYMLEDASALWEVVEFWINESGKSVANKLNTEPAKEKSRSASSAKKQQQSVKDESADEEEDEDDDTEISFTPQKSRSK